MNAIDAPVLSHLKLSLNCNTKRDEGPGFDDWFDAIFRSSQEATRVLSSVEKLTLLLRSSPERTAVEYHPPYDIILPAIPRIQHLRLDLPVCSAPRFHEILETCEDLRSVYMKNGSKELFTGDPSTLTEFFERPDIQKRLDKLDTLELEGFHQQSHYIGALRSALGDKLKSVDARPLGNDVEALNDDPDVPITQQQCCSYYLPAP